MTTSVSPLQTLVSDAKVKKEPSEQTIARRGFNATAMAELCSFSKTQKTVTRLLKDFDIQSLEPKPIAMNRVARILASKKIIEALMTPNEKKNYLELGQRCTPNQYLTIVRRGCTCSEKRWAEVTKK
jgi:hypothetical protein